VGIDLGMRRTSRLLRGKFPIISLGVARFVARSGRPKRRNRYKWLVRKEKKIRNVSTLSPTCRPACSGRQPDGGRAAQSSSDSS
jgi:hypothetical protein